MSALQLAAEAHSIRLVHSAADVASGLASGPPLTGGQGEPPVIIVQLEGAIHVGCSGHRDHLGLEEEL